MNCFNKENILYVLSEIRTHLPCFIVLEKPGTSKVSFQPASSSNNKKTPFYLILDLSLSNFINISHDLYANNVH